MEEANKFSFCHADGRLEEFESAAALARILGEYEYLTSILVAVDQELAGQGIHLVVSWCHNLVPKLDPRKSVLIVVGDERGQIPNGAGMARLVFRTGSPKTPWPVLRMGQRPFSLLLLSAIRELRNSGLRFKRWMTRRAPLWTPGHVESIPIGFVGATELKPVAMEDRDWDVSFAGGIGNFRQWGPLRIPLTAKSAARLAMLRSLKEVQACWPSLRGRFVFPDLEPHTALRREDYYKLLQQTKISLCPRGNFVETFRLFESARLGCAILTDPLPKCWYFANHPFVEVRDWREVSSIVMALLRDAGAVKEMGERSRKWWEDETSPAAVGSRIALAMRVK